MQKTMTEGNERNPSGATMIARQEIAGEKVDRHLRSFPPGRGDDVLLLFRFWAREQPDFVEAIVYYLRYVKEGKKHELPSWVMKQLLLLTAPETIRRRREEIQSLAEKQVKAQLAQMNFRNEEEREKQEKVLREMTHVLPLERTRNKRKRLENAMSNRFGSGNLGLMDYLVM